MLGIEFYACTVTVLADVEIYLVYILNSILHTAGQINIHS